MFAEDYAYYFICGCAVCLSIRLKALDILSGQPQREAAQILVCPRLRAAQFMDVSEFHVFRPYGECPPKGGE